MVSSINIKQFKATILCVIIFSIFSITGLVSDASTAGFEVNETELVDYSKDFLQPDIYQDQFILNIASVAFSILYNPVNISA